MGVSRFDAFLAIANLLLNLCLYQRITMRYVGTLWDSARHQNAYFPREAGQCGTVRDTRYADLGGTTLPNSHCFCLAICSKLSQPNPLGQF